MVRAGTGTSYQARGVLRLDSNNIVPIPPPTSTPTMTPTPTQTPTRTATPTFTPTPPRQPGPQPHANADGYVHLCAKLDANGYSQRNFNEHAHGNAEGAASLPATDAATLKRKKGAAKSLRAQRGCSAWCDL